jgi:hypothetical protein
MAKKTISGGGGGSLGKPVRWHQNLEAEVHGPQIPHDAVTSATWGTDNATRKRAEDILMGKVRAGLYKTAYGRKNGRRVRFYWPKVK